MIDQRVKNSATPRRTVRGLVDVGTETRAAALEEKMTVTVRTADPSQQGNPREALGAFEKAKMESLETADIKSKIAVTKSDKTFDEIPFLTVEFL